MLILNSRPFSTRAPNTSANAWLIHEKSRSKMGHTRPVIVNNILKVTYPCMVALRIEEKLFKNILNIFTNN